MKFYKLINKKLGRFLAFKSKSEAEFFVKELRFMVLGQQEDLAIIEQEIPDEEIRLAPSVYFFEDKRKKWVKT